MKIADQSGFAAVALLLIVLGAGAVFGQGASVRSQALVQADTERRLQALAQAKQALLDYATGYPDSYKPMGAGIGYLPCPDTSPVNDGILTNDGPNPPCKSRTLGRMPRYTFSADEHSKGMERKLIEFFPPLSLRDEQLWYVVSRPFVNNPASRRVNPVLEGTLQVDEETSVAAVLIAPGPPVRNQGRMRPSDNVHAYLELENADGDLRFSREQTTDNGSSGNDLIATIRSQEIFAVASQRVARLLVDLLQTRASVHCTKDAPHCFPTEEAFACEVIENCWFADALQTTSKSIEPEKHWLWRNDWLAVTDYQVSPHCLHGGHCTISYSIDENSLVPAIRIERSS